MKNPTTVELSRRQFLAAMGSTLALAAVPAIAADPPKRTGKPWMKLSLAAYSFNRQLERNWPKGRSKDGEMTLLDFIDFCGEMKLDGTELTGYYFPAEITSDYLAKVKHKVADLNMEISGTAIGNDFCVAGNDARAAQIGMCKEWIDYAAEMGAPVIRIFAGNVPKGDTEQAAIERCVSAINECLEYAAEKKVALALENHGGITATPEQLLGIVKQVDDSPYFGINFDGGNFRTADPYGDLAKIAPFAINAQIKVAISPNGGPKQPADLGKVVDILKQANYSGYVVLEYEEPEDPRERIPVFLKELRDLIA
ncbi:MAG: sugar phosphate isomerase/epimerase [Planctomycetaceae bacterium]|nr:sugar phosphate isomerase/epimerase [Planctomycetaceae bacterium]